MGSQGARLCEVALSFSQEQSLHHWCWSAPQTQPAAKAFFVSRTYQPAFRGTDRTGSMLKDDRFLIEETDPTTNYGYNYVVKQIGSQQTANQCKRERLLNSTEMSSRIVCGGQHIGFLMDTKTLRFQQIYGGSFLSGDGTDTPSLTIGKCSQIK